MRIRWRPLGQWSLILGVSFAAIALLTGNGSQLGLGVALVALVVSDRIVVSRSLDEIDVSLALPPLAVAGDDLALLASVGRCRRPARLDLLDPWRGVAGGVAPPGGEGVLAVAGPPRGTIPAVAAEVAVLGPLGLVSATRRVRRWLPVPAAIGPQPHEVAATWPEPTGALMGLDARSPRGRELTRGVRDYRPGDPRRRVHWKATARTGRLMVRETEGEAVGTLTVVVSVGQPGGAAEEAFSRARWYAEEGLRRGWVVRLVTLEVVGVPMLAPVDELWPPVGAGDGAPGWGMPEVRAVDAPVHTSTDVVRRLAGAVHGDVAVPRRSGAIRLVTESGDTWR